MWKANAPIKLGEAEPSIPPMFIEHASVHSVVHLGSERHTEPWCRPRHDRVLVGLKRPFAIQGDEADCIRLLATLCPHKEGAFARSRKHGTRLHLRYAHRGRFGKKAGVLHVVAFCFVWLLEALAPPMVSTK